MAMTRAERLAERQERADRLQQKAVAQRNQEFEQTLELLRDYQAWLRFYGTNKCLSPTHQRRNQRRAAGVRRGIHMWKLGPRQIDRVTRKLQSIRIP